MTDSTSTKPNESKESDSNDRIAVDHMLTTFDNPYNPFDEFELWFKTDMYLGYNSCGLLERTANVNNIQSDELNEKDISDAIDYIVSQNPLIYKKVSRKNYEK